MKKFKIASLFSGIGGFEEGIRLTGIPHEIVFASEIDRFAQKSYSANFGETNLFGDITKIKAEDIPNHDLVIAGFPCQSFSIAGKRKGFDDIRGTLFFDLVRVLVAKKPQYIILENVKNLVGHDRTNTIKTILKTLNDIGYTVDFSVVNSFEAGVPQNRDRTYIVGILGYPSEKFEIDFRNIKVSQLKNELNTKKFYGFNFFNNLKFSNEKRYIEDILEKNVSEKYYFNTKKINNFVKEIKIQEIEKNEDRIVKLFDIPREVHNDLERQRRVYSVKGISPTVLARSDSTKICTFDCGLIRVRKVTPEENFYIQGFSKEFVESIKRKGISDTQMYKQSGNAVSPPVIEGIFKEIHSIDQKRGRIESDR